MRYYVDYPQNGTIIRRRKNIELRIVTKPPKQRPKPPKKENPKKKINLDIKNLNYAKKLLSEELNREIGENINSWKALVKIIDPGRVYSKTTAKRAICAYFGVPDKHIRTDKNKEKLHRKAKKKLLPSHEFYMSDKWRSVRYKALKKHGACCQCCGRSYKKHKVVIHVDHVKPRSKYPELELELDNLQILCEDCNLGKMARDTTDWR